MEIYMFIPIVFLMKRGEHMSQSKKFLNNKNGITRLLYHYY
jgi:hypothetical protein